MQRSLALPLVLTLSLVACGGGGSDDPAVAAFTALDKGNFESALDEFDAALAALEQGSPDHKDLSLARVEALAHVEADKVLEAVEALGKLTPRDYGQLIGKLLQSESTYPSAVKVMDMGVAAYPDNPEMKDLETDTVATIRNSGDEAGGDALDSLGYSGED